VKLYVCWGTMWTPRLGGHPCRNAYMALREAGYDPEVERVYGSSLGPFQWTSTEGRKKIQELTGQTQAPVLVTDDGEAIHESARIAEWARAHPAGAKKPGLIDRLRGGSG
jgi:hypothetical protein